MLTLARQSRSRKVDVHYRRQKASPACAQEQSRLRSLGGIVALRDLRWQTQMLSVNDRAKELGAWLLKSTSTRSCKSAVRDVAEKDVRLC